MNTNVSKVEYRVVNGTSYEGLSIREVYFDTNGKIISYSKLPLICLASSTGEIKQEIVKSMQDLDKMLECLNKPILEEHYLESHIQ